MFRFLQYVMPWVFGRSLSNNSLEISSQLYKDLLQIRKEFKQFPGGSVDLLLNDETGIAQLCLNHPEKKNAISGKLQKVVTSESEGYN